MVRRLYLSKHKGALQQKVGGADAIFSCHVAIMFNVCCTPTVLQYLCIVAITFQVCWEYAALLSSVDIIPQNESRAVVHLGLLPAHTYLQYAAINWNMEYAFCNKLEQGLNLLC